MTEKRIVSIDPNMFKIPDKTRKKREPKPGIDKQIKVKNNIKNQRSTTMKRKLLNFIRKKQELKNQQQEKPDIEHFHEPNVYVESFDNDFQESLDYLDNLSKQNTNQQQTPYIDVQSPQLQDTHNTHNKTFKSYNYNETPVTLDLPDSLKDISQDMKIPTKSSTNIQPIQLITPQYGCLKNGQLPTYRTWKHNQTQKIYPSIDVNVKTPVISNQMNQPSEIPDSSIISQPSNNGVYNINPQRFNSVLESQKPLKKPKHRRKIIRRKFTIGRSKIAPKVSVLVSNKTIRKNIYTNKTLLKQTPLQDVKKFLIKRGFIKVGFLAPPDILRQMYESVKTLCGDATNHNPENLLYNYFNYNEDN